MLRHCLSALLGSLLALPSLAGPPYVTDDPVPTEEGHFETYLFNAGARGHDGWGGSAGIDFNYGGARDLQLTAALPLEWEAPTGGARQLGVGNIEFAAKYRFLHQADAGFDMAVFPRVFLPAPSKSVGERHPSLLLPLWIGRSGETWGSFGGAGCTLHRGGDAKDFCQLGLVVTRQLTQAVQLGAELYHHTADTRGGDPSTGVGLGLTVDLNENLHLMVSAGPGLRAPATTDHAVWYAALQLTY